MCVDAVNYMGVSCERAGSRRGFPHGCGAAALGNLGRRLVMASVDAKKVRVGGVFLANGRAAATGAGLVSTPRAAGKGSSARRWGGNCYGCWEPPDKRWQVLKRFPRMRRVSVPPWADVEEKAGYVGAKYRICLPTLVAHFFSTRSKCPSYHSDPSQDL